MKKAPVSLVLSTLVLVVAMSSVTHASAITGSLPAVPFNATENKANLGLSTSEAATQTITAGPGTGDFSVVGSMTNFGPITLDDFTVAVGGGVSIFNATYGGFVAASGSIVTQTSHFLNVSLSGTYTPGPGFPGLAPAPALADVSFNHTQAVRSPEFDYRHSSRAMDMGAFGRRISGMQPQELAIHVVNGGGEEKQSADGPAVMADSGVHCNILQRWHSQGPEDRAMILSMHKGRTWSCALAVK